MIKEKRQFRNRAFSCHIVYLAIQIIFSLMNIIQMRQITVYSCCNFSSELRNVSAGSISKYLEPFKVCNIPVNALHAVDFFQLDEILIEF